MSAATRLTGYTRKSQELTLREMREDEREKKRRADEAAAAAAVVEAERAERVMQFRHELFLRYHAARKLDP